MTNEKPFIKKKINWDNQTCIVDQIDKETPLTDVSVDYARLAIKNKELWNVWDAELSLWWTKNYLDEKSLGMWNCN